MDVIQALANSEAKLTASSECRAPVTPACTAPCRHAVAELTEPYNTMASSRESPPIYTGVEMAVNLWTVYTLRVMQDGVSDA